jgi:hypothetical protein
VQKQSSFPGISDQVRDARTSHPSPIGALPPSAEAARSGPLTQEQPASTHATTSVARACAFEGRRERMGAERYQGTALDVDRFAGTLA